MTQPSDDIGLDCAGKCPAGTLDPCGGGVMGTWAGASSDSDDCSDLITQASRYKTDGDASLLLVERTELEDGLGIKDKDGNGLMLEIVVGAGPSDVGIPGEGGCLSLSFPGGISLTGNSQEFDGCIEEPEAREKASSQDLPVWNRSSAEPSCPLELDFAQPPSDMEDEAQLMDKFYTEMNNSPETFSKDALARYPLEAYVPIIIAMLKEGGTGPLKGNAKRALVNKWCLQNIGRSDESVLCCARPVEGLGHRPVTPYEQLFRVIRDADIECGHDKNIKLLEASISKRSSNITQSLIELYRTKVCPVCIERSGGKPPKKKARKKNTMEMRHINHFMTASRLRVGRGEIEICESVLRGALAEAPGCLLPDGVWPVVRGLTPGFSHHSRNEEAADAEKTFTGIANAMGGSGDGCPVPVSPQAPGRNSRDG